MHITRKMQQRKADVCKNMKLVNFCLQDMVKGITMLICFTLRHEFNPWIKEYISSVVNGEQRYKVKGDIKKS